MNNNHITISEDKKIVTWNHKQNEIRKVFNYPIDDLEVTKNNIIYILSSYKEVTDSRNVFQYDFLGNLIGTVPLPFTDINIRSFYGMDLLANDHITFYLDTLTEKYQWETRIKYDPSKKIFYDRKRCK